MTPVASLIAELTAISPTYHPSPEACNPPEKDEFGYPTNVLDEMAEDFARHLIGLLERQETVDFCAIFTALDAFTHRAPLGNVIEVFGSCTDQSWGHEIRDAFVVSLIDCLKDVRLYTTGDPAQFVPYLTPAQQAEWRKVRRDDVVTILYDLCPSFQQVVKAGIVADDWTNEAGYPLIYLFLGAFARHLVGMLERGETAAFPAIFREVERFITEGIDDVRQAMVIGLLEDLQNTNIYTTGNPAQFRCYLGKKSEVGWNELYRSWGDAGNNLNDSRGC